MRRISNPLVQVLLRIQHIKCGKQCKFYGFPIIVNQRGKIEIGSDLTLASSFLSNLVGLYQRSVIVARNGGKVKIGNKVAMSAVTIYAFKHIEIGDHTLIGANTKIIDSDMHPTDPSKRVENPQDRENTHMNEIVIGKNVFVGCNCIILKGVHIGNNSVIGAGSVVTRDIPENSVAAGNPAKIIKMQE